MTSAREAARDDPRLAVALAAATCLALSPAVGAGWLDYDDGWLVRDNPLVGSSAPGVAGSILWDLSRDTRLVLGAEYLPVRDLVAWLLWGVLGAPVWALHAAQLALYTAGVLLVRRWLHAVVGAPPVAELAAWLFALHPVHVEAVAWLASLKDVLLLVLGAGALVAWSSARPRARTAAVALAVLACLAKGAGVVLPALFVVSDLLAGRPVDRARAGLALAGCAALAALHAHVGSVVGMYAEPLGGSRVITAATMLAVAWRYLALSFGLAPQSIVYEVEPLEPGSAPVVFSALGLAALLGLAAWAWRRGARWPLLALALFAVPLLPVAQVIAPLQNRMADRYLLLALLGPMLALAHALGWMGAVGYRRVTRYGGAAVALALALLAFLRAATFASPVAVFAEATERTTRSAVPPYQLAMALEREGRDADAEGAFALAIARDGLTTEVGRRAGNNLGRLLARHGRLPEAVALYRELRARYPDDPRVLHNLSVLLDEAGERDEAARLRAELERRFPDYETTRNAPHVGP